MPSGKVHDKITLITTPIIFAISLAIIDDIKLTITLIISYLFSSLMFNGDLDIISKPYNRWFLFKFIWIPYQKIFKHRSIFTHGIVIGTIIRIIYFGIVIFPILYYLNLFSWFIKIPIIHYIIIFIGLELGNTIHTLSDKIF